MDIVESMFVFSRDVFRVWDLRVPSSLYGLGLVRRFAYE